MRLSEGKRKIRRIYEEKYEKIMKENFAESMPKFGQTLINWS